MQIYRIQLNELSFNFFHVKAISRCWWISFSSPASFLTVYLSWHCCSKAVIISVYSNTRMIFCKSVDKLPGKETFRVLWTEVKLMSCHTVAWRPHHMFVYHLYTSRTIGILLILPYQVSKIFQVILLFDSLYGLRSMYSCPFEIALH